MERDRALAAIDELIGSAQEGHGSALLIEGQPGMGKTRLHEAALDRGREAGLTLLRAGGAELERNLAHGVAERLLARLLDELPASRRDALLAQAPERVRMLAGARPRSQRPSEAGELSISHGIFALLAATGAPTLLAIDDLHWCDAASLELVLYVLHRIDELPLAILLTRRQSTVETSQDMLERVASHPAVRLERLGPLTRDSVAEIVRATLGERAETEVIEACHRATGGNPFYLRELLLALGDRAGLAGKELVREALALAPDAVTRSLRVRVGRLGTDAALLARAVAILGDDVPLRQAAALAGLPVRAAATAADALADAEVLLAREPLRYVHPLVRRAIELDIPAAERATQHLDAARLLYAEGEGAERVAAQLMLGRAEGSEWVVGRLCAAAREAELRGAPRSAIDYLSRALREPPGAEDRPEVLAALGAAEAATGSDAAVEHLEAAAQGACDLAQRARLALVQGNSLYRLGLYERAASAYARGRRAAEGAGESVDADLLDSLNSGYLATATQVPALRRQALADVGELLGGAGDRPRSRGQRMLLTQAALHSAFAARPAQEVFALAGGGWDDGRLLAQDGPDGITWSLAVQAVTLAGDLERAVDLTEAVLTKSRQAAAPLADATARYCRGLPLLWQGQVSDAVADLEQALEATRYGWRRFVRSARATLALCLLERGEHALAEQELQRAGAFDAQRDLEDAYCLYVRAELRLAQGRTAEALADSLASGEAIGDDIRLLGFCHWRTAAALAAVALGDRSRAIGLAGEELELSEQADVFHGRVRGRWVLGLCESPPAGLRRLEEAAEIGRGGPKRLETVRALVELGAALRRANRRAAARDPLQQAADLALAGGASALHARAHTELSATGSRPRREWLVSGPQSLTPSERRIAELAAAGHSNREIAQTLFVTSKTVEYHLRNTYRKLGVEGRGDLAQALGRTAAGAKD